MILWANHLRLMENNWRYLAEKSRTPLWAGRDVEVVAHSFSTNGVEDVSADVSVVVICHNNRAEVGRCLESVLDLQCSVFLIDTASTDGSAGYVRDRYPTVQVVELGENRGFGTAANDGFGLARTRYVLLLNADAWAKPGAVKSLVAAADRTPSVGAIGPRLVYPDGSDQRSVFGYPQGSAALAALVAFPGLIHRLYPLRQRLRGRRERLRASPDSAAVQKSEFISGAVLLVRREVFTDVGGFDPRFFMYCEEIDLCRRLRGAGRTIAFHPGATFTHVGGASTRQEPERMYGELIQSYLYLIAKHRGPSVAERARLMSLGALAVRGFVLPGRKRRRARFALRRLRSAESRSALLRFGSGPA